MLSGYEKLYVCTGYDIDGKIYDTVPASLKDYARAKAVYKVFDGWNEDISSVRTFAELPKNCQEYIRFIEDYCKTDICLVSVSPERNGNIILKELI